MKTRRVAIAAINAHIAGFFDFLFMYHAMHQKTKAAAVLLSVKSLPNGHPVQYASKAYF